MDRLLGLTLDIENLHTNSERPFLKGGLNQYTFTTKLKYFSIQI